MDNVRSITNEDDGIDLSAVLAFEPMMWEVKGHTYYGFLAPEVYPTLTPAVELGANNVPQAVIPAQLLVATFAVLQSVAAGATTLGTLVSDHEDRIAALEASLLTDEGRITALEGA